jgi:MFS family permease
LLYSAEVASRLTEARRTLTRRKDMEDERDVPRPWACFDRRFLAVSLGLALAIVALALLMKRNAPGSAARVGLGIALAALIAGFVLYVVAAVRKLDELGQRIQLQAIAIAFAASAALFSACGMLAHAGLPAVDLGLWAWPVMAVFWGIAAFVVERRYR